MILLQTLKQFMWNFQFVFLDLIENFDEPSKNETPTEWYNV